MKVVLLYQTAVSDDCTEERITIVIKTGTNLEHFRGTQFLPQYGQMPDDETGRLKIGIPRFR